MKTMKTLQEIIEKYKGSHFSLEIEEENLVRSQLLVYFSYWKFPPRVLYVGDFLNKVFSLTVVFPETQTRRSITLPYAVLTDTKKQAIMDSRRQKLTAFFNCKLSHLSSEKQEELIIILNNFLEGCKVGKIPFTPITPDNVEKLYEAKLLSNKKP